MSGSYGFGASTCQICRQNLSYPYHLRPICPYHPPTEVHHHHHYTPPTAPSASPFPPPPVYPNPQTSWPGPPNIKSYSWVDSSLGRSVPPTAVIGGRDIDGQVIYVGRAYHERDLIPAKIIPGRRCCYISYNGKEYAKGTFQILCDTRAEWVPGHRGSVHPDAVEGGKTETGETLYIGRVLHKNSHTVGKIHPSHGTCYIPFDQKEIGYPNYEVLISRMY